MGGTAFVRNALRSAVDEYASPFITHGRKSHPDQASDGNLLLGFFLVANQDAIATAPLSDLAREEDRKGREQP